MTRRTLFRSSLLFVFIGVVFGLTWHLGSFANGDDPPPVFQTTLVFTDNEGIQVSTNTDTVTKQEYCGMVEHSGNSSCGTNTPSDHPISTMWDPGDRKVIITIEDDVAGYGQAKASITSGSTVVGGETIEFSNLGGDVVKVGTWSDPDVRKCTHKCDYDTITCNKCDGEVKTKLEHYRTCGAEVPGATAGCGVRYWTCQSSSHDVMFCGNWSSFGNLCGDLYRVCTNPSFPNGGCHYWRAHPPELGMDVCDSGCFGSSCTGCNPYP